MQAATKASTLGSGCLLAGVAIQLADFPSLVRATAQGFGPFEAGARTLPWTAMPMFVAPIRTGLLSDRSAPAADGAGLALQAIGLGWIA